MDIKQKADLNVKLYPIYKTVGYDYVFYYAINILFLTLAKGFSISQILFLTAFYTACIFVCQFPVNIIIDKLGLKKSIILGNFLHFSLMIVYIFANHIGIFYIAQVFAALSTTMKSITEGSILYESLMVNNRQKEFSKYEGRGNSGYYFFDAIASICAGYLFTINCYLPVYFSLFFAFVAFVISTQFKNIESSKDLVKETFSDIFCDFKKILKSKRLKSIYIVAFFLTGIMAANATLYKAILIDLEIHSEILGIIIAGFTILSGIGARMYYKIERKTKKKTLTIFSILFTLCLTAIGLVSYVNINYKLSIFLIIMMAYIMAIIFGAYRVGLKKYTNSFTVKSMRTKIISAYYIFENLGMSIILFLSGVIVNNFNNSIAAIIIGISGFLIMLCVLQYIKDKFGLEPEKYNLGDINNLKGE